MKIFATNSTVDSDRFSVGFSCIGKKCALYEWMRTLPAENWMSMEVECFEVYGKKVEPSVVQERCGDCEHRGSLKTYSGEGNWFLELAGRGNQRG